MTIQYDKHGAFFGTPEAEIIHLYGRPNIFYPSYPHQTESATGGHISSGEVSMKILNFNWATLDVRGGVKYAIGVTIVIALSLVIEFSWMAVGLSALLAWLVNVPGPRRDRLKGVVIYIVVGAALIGLVYALSGTYWPWLISMLLVAFLGTFAMIRGPRGFMLGWCLICLFFVAPLLGTAKIPLEVLSAHLLGSGVMLLLIALPFGKNADAEGPNEETASAESPSVAFVASYATTVAIVMTIGLVLGDLWLKSDPTLILQASLMIILPSARGTWVVAVDRMLGLIAGIVAGFYLGQFAGGPVLEILVWISASFMVVTLMDVNAGAMILFFILPYSVVWGVLDGEAGHAIANERIVAELIGVVFAGIAVSMREVLARKFGKQPQ